MVHVNFNLVNHSGGRAIEHVGFPFTLPSLSDVPDTGDYFVLQRYNANEKKEYNTMTMVVGRLVHVVLDNADMHREVQSIVVTLMLDDQLTNTPDFRG